MAVGVGFPTTFGHAEEVTYGTPLAATKWSEIISENLQISREPIVKESLRRASQSTTFQGIKAVAGEVNAEAFMEGQLRLFKHLFGAVADSTLEAGRFQHDFTFADTLPIGLTLEIGRPIQGFRYHGAKINTGDFSINVNEVLKVNLGFLCEDEEKFTVGAATFPTERLIPFHQGVFTVAAVATDIDAFSMSIGNSLKGDRQKLGSELTKEPVRDGLREVTGEFSKDYETADIAANYDKFTAMTDVALKLDFTGAVLLAGNYKWTLDLFRVKFGGVTPTVAGPGIMRLTIPFRALFDEAGAQDSVRLRIVNAEATT